MFPRRYCPSLWKNQRDIPDVISIGKLVRKNDGSEQLSQYLLEADPWLTKYPDKVVKRPHGPANDLPEETP